MFRIQSLSARLTTLSIVRPCTTRNAFPCIKQSSWIIPRCPIRSLSSTRALEIPEVTLKSSQSEEKPLKVSKASEGRAANQRSKTSLRRVAVEAERSRGGAKGAPAKKSKADRDVDAKVVTAYCAAEQYSMTTVSQSLEAAGYSLDPFATELYPQVVHFRVPSNARRIEAQTDGDIFVFPSGTVVAWDVEEGFVKDLISKTLLPTAENPHFEQMETEDLEFIEDPENHTSSVVGDTIRLGTGTQASNSDEQVTSAQQQHDTDLALVKIAFSSGLAGSAKLAVLESSLESYFKSTRSIPAKLAKGSRLPFTRSFILRKTGELLNARAQLNLNSELTDSLPDMFWDTRHDLGLEGYFDRVGKALDVNVRSRVLNQKMDYAQEIVTVLREQLSEKHGLALEWLIIILIAIEVAFEVLFLYRERLEKADPESMHSLHRRFLERQLDEAEK